VEAALHTEPVRQQTDIPAEFVAEKTTGNTPLDRSIEKRINEMKFIAPFDRESQDLQRTYTIEFNLRPKSIG
jgi:hypothetical protein